MGVVSSDVVRAGRRVWKIVMIVILASAAIRLIIKLVEVITGRDASG
jgi:hypothetical protein